MKEYKKKLQDAMDSFIEYKQLKETAYSLDPEQHADEILSLFDESKKLRRKASKQLSRLAEYCGFKILKDINNDARFDEVWTAIKNQIDYAMDAFHNISRFNHSIDLA